jgi:hypothetical protein
MSTEPNRVELLLPALVGNSSLGFLAALGLQALCCEVLGDLDAQIGWPNGATMGATLSTTAASSVDELAFAIAAIAAERTSGSYLPNVEGLPPDFVGPAAGTDPLREFSVATGRSIALSVLEAPLSERWVTGLLALDEGITEEKRNGSLPVSPLAARGPGTVMFYRTLRDLAKGSATPESIQSALIFWQRSDSIGGYLEYKAARDASYQASKKDADNYGVVAAGWLAMMSIAHFPALTAGRDVAISACWPREPRRDTLLRWPVPGTLLGTHELAVLLSHPAVATVDRPASKRTSSILRALSVLAIYESERVAAGNNDGPLGKPIRLWPPERK